MLATKEMIIAKIFAINKVSGIESSSGSKSVKPKTQRLKDWKLSKAKKPSNNGNLSKFTA